MLKWLSVVVINIVLIDAILRLLYTNNKKIIGNPSISLIWTRISITTISSDARYSFGMIANANVLKHSAHSYHF